MSILGFTLRQADRVLQQVLLEADGTVTRLVPVAGPDDDGVTEVGWWRGRIDASVAELARGVAGGPWPAVVQSRPPAAGSWVATADGGRRGLWDGAGDDEVGAALQSLRSECASVATEAHAAVAFSATRAADAGAPVLLRTRSTGAEAVHLVLRDEAHTPGETVVFITEEADVVGYLAEPIELPAGVEAVGVLGGRSPGPDGLRLEGTIWAGDLEQAALAATVAVAPG